MSPVAAALDGLLAVLLLLALGLGMKLNARLKALRESQAGFATAVTELNQAAARAEAGLAALRTASESAHDDLLARIETARGLVTKLERASGEAQRVVASAPDRPASARERPAASSTLAAIAALAEGRAVERGPAERAPVERPSPAPPRRPARAALDDDLFETRDRSDLGPLRMTRGDPR